MFTQTHQGIVHNGNKGYVKSLQPYQGQPATTVILDSGREIYIPMFLAFSMIKAIPDK